MFCHSDLYYDAALLGYLEPSVCVVQNVRLNRTHSVQS